MDIAIMVAFVLFASGPTWGQILVFLPAAGGALTAWFAYKASKRRDATNAAKEARADNREDFQAINDAQRALTDQARTDWAADRQRLVEQFAEERTRWETERASLIRTIDALRDERGRHER